jgi:hypothetical protein
MGQYMKYSLNRQNSQREIKKTVQNGQNSQKWAKMGCRWPLGLGNECEHLEMRSGI